MRLRGQARVKFLALVLAGGMLFSLLQNCAVFGGQFFQDSLNYTWFLTCRTDTLFSGDGLIIDCENVSDANTVGTVGDIGSLLTP